MPFGSYQVNAAEGVTNAIRIMKESGCDALKMEGGVEILDTVKRILDAGIPVMAHLGLTPQSINKFGTYAVRATDPDEAQRLLHDAHVLQDAGCFALVLEKIPAALAATISSEIKIPIIGIGAGPHVDGQVLQGMANIGKRPTLDNGDQLSIEVNLFDFDDDIYGKDITLEFISFLRLEFKMCGLEELKHQLTLDRNNAKRILNDYSTTKQ